jgi:hypothetical protein
MRKADSEDNTKGRPRQSAEIRATAPGRRRTRGRLAESRSWSACAPPGRKQQRPEVAQTSGGTTKPSPSAAESRDNPRNRPRQSAEIRATALGRRRVEGRLPRVGLASAALRANSARPQVSASDSLRGQESGPTDTRSIRTSNGLPAEQTGESGPTDTWSTWAALLPLGARSRKSVASCGRCSLRAGGLPVA